MLKVTWLGHACFTLDDGNSRIVIDPFLTGNPVATVAPGDLEVDAVLVTHGHGDHLGDAVDISRRNGAPLIAPFELAKFCERQGATVHPMHIGGSHVFPFGRVKLTIAHHGSAFVGAEAEYTGNPCGFLVTMAGRTVYHAGDTGLFSDMRLIGELNEIDAALLPIGDNFTMGPEDARVAAGFLKAKTVIPMHYNTFELIAQDPDAFTRSLPEGCCGVVLQVNETYTLE
ncbi:MAG: metal-dependent hydrolase [Desulfuromonadales bacterium]|jgi:L-ascorbate metabolism protein UlaG (beta-lactamase superfamily)